MVDRLVNSEANARRIATVENCFGANGQPLAIQGRVLVGEGVVTKMCRKKPKTRQFFLFNDILVYGNIVMDKKKYNKQHIIPLEEVKLENLEDDGILKNGWLIRTPTKSFAVYAATATEKTEWMAHINKCVEDLLKKTGKKPSLEHAAVWIPDAEASICMHCRKTQFTVLNRRHHCRKCGAVVCNPCSSKKFLLPAQSSKPLRVCLSCYDTLTKARSNQGGAPYKPPMNKSVNQDSSGEDDSEDEMDDIGKNDDPVKGLDELSIDEKPTFYGDTAEPPSESSHPTSSNTSVVNLTSDTSTYETASAGGNTSPSGTGGSSTCDVGGSSSTSYAGGSSCDAGGSSSCDAGGSSCDAGGGSNE